MDGPLDDHTCGRASRCWDDCDGCWLAHGHPGPHICRHGWKWEA